MDSRGQRARDPEGLTLKVLVEAFLRAHKDQQLLPGLQPLPDPLPLRDFDWEVRNQTNGPSLMLAISRNIGRCYCPNSEE